MASEEVALERIRRAAQAGAGVVRETPVVSSRTLGERAGGTIVLKAENLQRTGSFKLRGALAKIAALGDDGCAAGVVAGSAGNHAQAVAYAARARGVACEVYMPAGATISKLDACEEFGATVHLVDGPLDDAVAAARERARTGGLAFIHPYDDVDVIAGQGGVGLELVAQVPELARVVVPVGGGGLASGLAIAVKTLRPELEVIGVQAERCAPFPAALAQGAPAAIESPALTIADGIAVKQPGELTLPLVRAWLDGVVAVAEDDIAEAMVLLLERAKLVVEGAGAVGVAALLTGRVAPAAEGVTAVVLSGGNVDAGLLASATRRHETAAGRRLVLLSRVGDRPGELGRLLTLVGAHGANLVDVEHVREGLELHVRETAVQLVLETRGAAHAREVVAAVAAAGYEARTVS
jgi:threonine dehydratase